MKKMKVLWFTSTSSLYDQGNHPYNGCGWIESLEELLKKEDSIELAVSFFHSKDSKKKEIKDTIYYPILRKKGKQQPFKHIWRNWNAIIENEIEIIPNLLKVISDFKPDVIHVFGTEEVFAAVQKYTKTPVIIHIQGLLNPLINAYYPSGTDEKTLRFSRYFWFKNLLGLGTSSAFRRKKQQAKREINHLKNAKYVMGRTEWDRQVSKFYNPSIKYYHIDEILRSIFYNEVRYKNKEVVGKIILTSTLSPTIYKGLDIILKTSALLSDETNLNFEWQIIGVDANDKLLKHFIRSTKTSTKNLRFLGKKSAEEISKILQNADFFIHPTQIDNSPNSICEAQISKTPVIASNVGGISSLIENKKNGFLVPSNGIYEIATTIIEMTENKELLNEVAISGFETASKRHDRKKVVENLLEVYNTTFN